MSRSVVPLHGCWKFVTDDPKTEGVGSVSRPEVSRVVPLADQNVSWLHELLFVNVPTEGQDQSQGLSETII